MKKNLPLVILLVVCFWGTINAQTNYTTKITNPSFETGNGTGWTWRGADGYSWIGPNTDGDATKDGSYINGLWNSSISDVECSQTVTGLPNGYYQVSVLISVSYGRLTNQRLFASSGGTTKSMLYGPENHRAYSASNKSIIANSEDFIFGGYSESSAENGPFYKLSVVKYVDADTLTIGIRVSGKSTTQGYDFSYTSRGDAGFFKFDNFTLTEVSDVATLNYIALDAGFLDTSFDPSTETYTATIPQNTTTIKPTVTPSVEGVSVTGDEAVDVSSGTGTSTITVTALDGQTQKVYTINYKIAASEEGSQQEKLYADEFPLGDVKLLDSPFKHARDLNIQTLLKYDVDRLLAPYRKEAGLTPKAASYPNWIGLDGHIGGHYLSAVSMNYAATGDTACKGLMDYMVSELKACQDANTKNHVSWGVGYAGGVPNSSSIWSTFKTGNFSAFNSAWVPWYNVHKSLAGLRDAWLYGGSSEAKNIFLAFCDWTVNITSALSNAQMESMLNTEHGGMNEVLADAYQMTGNSKYLDAAKRFSHKVLLNSMAASVDNLDNMHANTQIPKAIGFERIAELTHDANYTHAANFFWQTVTENRCIASGGVGRKEYFPQASASSDYVNDVEGPESCATYNMLKLTEDLFRANPSAKYADYYERALYDHILSTQNPDNGGYVYFTPARPRHYRVYSAPGQAMWCCVGTGMENHGKYGEFIYTHVNDSLYLNLFIASELDWKQKGVTIRQETTFPNEEQTKLYISAEAPTSFNLLIRSPKWVKKGALKIIVNTDTLAINPQPETYISVNRTWNTGDSVKVLLPMHNSVEELPHVPSYVALMRGPILLGAKTGTQDLAGLIADDSRWGHIASGTLLPLDKAPVIVSNRDSIASDIIPVKGKPMTFKANGLFPDEADTSLVLEPFYKIHDARYMMYWLALNQDQYQHVLDSLAAEQQAALELDSRTIDKVAPGEQQPEVDHNLQSSNSYTGNWQNEFWRDARDGGYISYTFSTQEKSDLSLMVRYWGNEAGNRTFDILIDGVKLTTENLVGKWNVSQFFNVEYPIPNSMTEGKQSITVKFQAINSSNFAGGLFDVRLLEPLNSTGIEQEMKVAKQFKLFVKNKTIVINELPKDATVTVYDLYGRMLARKKATQNTLLIPCDQTGLKIVQILSDGKINAGKVIVQ